jgi:hypothetical protein
VYLPQNPGPSARNGGGEGGIRTHGTVAGTRDFQSRRFGHSRTSPQGWFWEAEGSALLNTLFRGKVHILPWGMGGDKQDYLLRSFPFFLTPVLVFGY